VLGQGAGTLIVAGAGEQRSLLGYRGKTHVQGEGDGTPLLVGSQGRESP
jgi:hypothetical protein